MSLRTDAFDLGRLRLTAGEGRRLGLEVAIEQFLLGGERYSVNPALVPVRIDLSRATGGAYALRMRFEATLVGPCMRCLQSTSPLFEVDAREVSQPGAIDALDSPYVEREVLDVHAWARDALALTLPVQLRCRPDCAGLCPVCGVDLGAAGAGHEHERGPDPRWAKLSELRFQ